MKKLVSLLLLFICALPTTVAARQFDIELIVFKRLVNPDQVEESWPEALPAIDFNNVGSFDDHNYQKKKGASVRPRSAHRLSAMAKNLENHAGYEVLLHQMWRQGDGGPSSAPKFRLKGGNDYSNLSHFDKSQQAAINQFIYELDGKIQVYVQHYLFLETTLNLTIPGSREVTLTDKTLELTDAESNDTVQVGHLTEVSPVIQQEHFLKSYRMQQKRRMKSGEIHYLDHPLMGVIIQVRRL